MTTALLLALVFVLAVLACGAYRRLALHWQVLDVPNERSSHALPTPRGGGAGILVAFGLALVVAQWWEGPWPLPFWVLFALALGLGTLGIMDDVLSLPRRGRFALYTLAALVAAGYLLQPVLTGMALYSAVAVAGLALLWLSNLYNFMDGIDGIAATQAFTTLGAIAVLAVLYGGRPDYALYCLLFAFAHLGFLIWNWAPARLFMGDCGSVPTGFLLGGLALMGQVEQIVPLAAWLILLAAFITDATYTLVWRMLTGQPFLSAHRLHLYQRLSRYWGSHQNVVLLLLAIQGLWLMPLAGCVVIFPEFTFILVILAYLPLLFGMVKWRHLP